jgi:hypothetical protein
VACADSILQFWLERRDGKMKRYRKMKWMQRARLGSMGRKRDMSRWCGDVGRRRGDIGEGKERRRRQLG